MLSTRSGQCLDEMSKDKIFSDAFDPIKQVVERDDNVSPRFLAFATKCVTVFTNNLCTSGCQDQRHGHLPGFATRKYSIGLTSRLGLPIEVFNILNGYENIDSNLFFRN